MYCSNCGEKIPDEAKFCPNSGTPVRHAGGPHIEKNPYPMRQPAGADFSGYNQRRPVSHRKSPVQVTSGQSITFGILLQYGLLSVIGGILLLISAFLPIAEFSGFGLHLSVGFFNYPAYVDRDGHTIMLVMGIIMIGLASGIILCAAFRKKPGAIGLSIGGLAYTVFLLFVWLTNGNVGEYGPGPALSVAGALVALIGSFFIRRKKGRKMYYM